MTLTLIFIILLNFRIVEALERISQNVDLGNSTFERFVSPRVMTSVRDLSSETDLVIGLSLVNGAQFILEQNLNSLLSESQVMTNNTDAAIILPKSILIGNYDTGN